MLNTPEPVETVLPIALGPHLSAQGAQLRANELLAEAEAGRLAAEYRRSHPETTFRYRAAVALRRLADRIAPPPCAAPPRPRVVRS